MTGPRRIAALAAALVLTAAAFDSPSLYVPGIALALLDAGLWAWVRVAARGTRVTIAPLGWSVSEGEPFPLAVELSGRLPRAGLSFEHPLLEDPGGTPRFDGRRATLELVFTAPGRCAVEPVRLVVADPLGLHRRIVRSNAGPRVLVLPRVEPVRNMGEGGALTGQGAAGHAGRGEAGSAADTRSVDFELDGLRPYREGGPASRIHWPTVARCGELVEHRLLSGAAEVPVVVLDLSGSPGPGAVTACLRAAASIVHGFSRSGSCLVLVPGQQKPVRVQSGRRGWPEAHARIACAQPGSPAGTPRGLRASRGLIIVTPGDAVPGSLASLVTSGGYLVSPALAPSARVSFTVAGCAGAALAGAQPPARPVPVRMEAA